MEIHQHKDNKIYKALYNGTRSLPETLVSMITTRGDDLHSFCKEMDDYCISILRGTSTAEDFFVDIYALDPDDDIWDENNWAKSNPFTFAEGNGALLETLRADAQTARDMQGSDLRDFIVKGLNMWVENTDNQFVNATAFESCASKKTLEDFKGMACWVGLDLSSGGDLTSYALEFAYKSEMGKDRYYIYSHSFMPRGRLNEHIETDLAPYDIWEKKELITVTGGENDFKNDYSFIIADLKRLKEEYGFKFLGIGIDPHNADGILSELDGLADVLIVNQSAKSLNDATVDIRLLVKSGDVEYNENDELLAWSFLNARIVRNSFGEIKVDKKPGKQYSRIDPVDAVIDAHTARIRNKASEQIDTEAALASYLSAMKKWR